MESRSVLSLLWANYMEWSYEREGKEQRPYHLLHNYSFGIFQ